MGHRAVQFNTARASQIAVQRLEADEHYVLVEGGIDARYLSTGHIAYLQAGSSLVVASFDPQNLRLTGPAIPIADDVAPFMGVGHFAFSAPGWLAYAPSVSTQQGEGLVWVDLTGNAEPLPAPPLAYAGARLSPDGQRLVVEIQGDPDIWVSDLARNTITRLTFDGVNVADTWSPDGTYVAFNSRTGSLSDIFRVPADGSGGVEQLTTTEFGSNANSWSPDGRTIVFTERDPAGRDLMLLDLEEKKVRPFLRTPFNEGAAKFSPNGEWLAYVSDESGRAEIYVRPYPGPGRMWQISTRGGTEPVWAPDGRILFYRIGYQMMAVDIALEPSFLPGTPQLLFERPYLKALWEANYDVARDGARFVMIKGGENITSASQVKIILHWFEELERLVPTDN